jgi:hypothetical protein
MRNKPIRWFRKAGLEGVVGTYNADDAENSERQVVEDVRALEVLVVVCTDALGMGSDVKQVARVIQWGLDSTTTITSFWQRIGRAGRDFGTTGVGYLFVQQPLVPLVVKTVMTRGPFQIPSSRNNILPRAWPAKRTKAAKETHSSVDVPILAMVIDMLTKYRCPRRDILRHLNQPESSEIAATEHLYISKTPYSKDRPRVCCNAGIEIPLQPTLPERPKAPAVYVASGVVGRRVEMMDKLLEWRGHQWRSVCCDSGRGGINWFFPMAALEQIVSSLGGIENDVRLPDTFLLTKHHKGYVPPDVIPLLVAELRRVILEPVEKAQKDKAALSVQRAKAREIKKVTKAREKDQEKAPTLSKNGTVVCRCVSSMSESSC